MGLNISMSGLHVTCAELERKKSHLIQWEDLALVILKYPKLQRCLCKKVEWQLIGLHFKRVCHFKTGNQSCVNFENGKLYHFNYF